MSKRILLALLLALCLVALAACGDAPAEEAATDEAAVEGSTLDAAHKDYVTFSAANVPLIDPATAYDEAASYYLPNVYDPLVWPDHEGVTQPWVATEWEASEDGLTWTFKIRDDVTFHNGESLVASDVAYSMNRLIEMGQGFAYLFSSVTGAEAPDDTTVVFHLSEPFANFANCLVRLYIVDESQIKEHQQDGSYGENGDYGTNWLLNADCGSGPYCLEELSGESYVMGKKFDDYWYGWAENAPGGFKLIGTTESVTIMTMMSRHDLEISDAYQSPEAFSNLDDLDGIDLTYFNTAGITFMTLNNQKAPTDDVHFRKALAYMIDYSTMVESLYMNCKVPEDMVNSVVPGYTAGNWPYHFDLEKAQEELAQSAYADKLADYPLEVVWNPENPEREQFFLVLQSTASQFGITVDIVQKSWIQVIEDASSADSTANCSLCWCQPDYLEAGSMLNAQWTTQEVGTWYTMDWVQDPELDVLIKSSLYEPDYDTRISMYKEAISKLIDNCCSIPVAEMYETHATQSDYFYWDIADRAANGQPCCPIMGYLIDIKSMKVYPDKR